jgi:hypothetical protein
VFSWLNSHQQDTALNGAAARTPFTGGWFAEESVSKYNRCNFDYGLVPEFQTIAASLIQKIATTATKLFLVALALAGVTKKACAEKPFAITVVEKGSGWPVPLVELRTVHQVRFISDNAGRIAFDLPELMGRETWFEITSDGYEAPADGFGKRGIRLTPEPGKSATVNVNCTSIAKRLGRLTGAGLFGESQKLGLEKGWPESGVVGCDSVVNAVYDGKMFWSWGDTSLARYPLGIFDSTGATTPTRPLERFEPPLRLPLKYFTDDEGRPRGIAKMPGRGPTWIRGCATLPDKTGASQLVATYMKIKPPLEVYEFGLCRWDDEKSQFEHVRSVWKKTDEAPRPPLVPIGHSVVVNGDGGKKWVLFGEPLPSLRCPATFEAWQNPATWEKLNPQKTLPSAVDGAAIKPASGSITWNRFRQRWVTVFLQGLGLFSMSGEIWYAEAASPYGPWGPAVKILSHKNYTFYNPRIHPEFTAEVAPVLLFEGTYTQAFANRPEPTPRYDYNQVLYRLDLDDAQLAPARGSTHQKDEQATKKGETQ